MYLIYIQHVPFIPYSPIIDYPKDFSDPPSDPPWSSSTCRYVHRVGRTARMGHSGEALIFLMPHERRYVELLAKRGIALQVGAADICCCLCMEA